MRIVFLDIDGVLNSDSFLNRDRGTDPDGDWVRWWTDCLDPAAVGVLNRVCEESGARIVLSSSRRLWLPMGDLRHVLGLAGVRGEIVGLTPHLPGRTRGREILEWIRVNGPSSFVILDDDDDMEGLGHRLVRIDPSVGLTLPDAVRAVEILGDPTERGGRPGDRV